MKLFLLMDKYLQNNRNTFLNVKKDHYRFFISHPPPTSPPHPCQNGNLACEAYELVFVSCCIIQQVDICLYV